VTSDSPAFPRFRAVADHAVLVELGDRIDASIHDRVRHLDTALQVRPFTGFAEAVPAYASVLVEFDPLVTDHAAATRALRELVGPSAPPSPPAPPPEAAPVRDVLVCYEESLAPDLERVATRCGLTREAVVAAHLSGQYRVAMYGFAPGYAYLAGVPESIRLPRKPAPVRDVPAGTVLIAGAQCLVTTLAMPTGWWAIGRSPTRILRADSDRPFLFDVGDGVRFGRIDRRAFDAAVAAADAADPTRVR